MTLDPEFIDRLYVRAGAARWRVDRGAFARALENSAGKAFAGAGPDAKTLEHYLAGLHLDDLALACACAAGDEDAWQHFVLVYRPALYRAADAIDPTGGSRDIADSLYGDLFGLGGKTGERQSLFRYFHGRSSLATWLRAVMSQRHVDRVRERRKAAPIPDDDSPAALPSPAAPPDPERARFVTAMRSALAFALALLAPKDRMRVACYYAQQMTLAQIGRLLGEHEATVSRQLARARASVRESVEQRLRIEHHFTETEVTECFRSTAEDAGPLDLNALFVDHGVDPAAHDPGTTRKLAAADRSREEGR